MVYNIWSIAEKRKLAQLLDVYPLGAYKVIAKRLGTKSADEVQTFIEKMKYSAVTYTDKKPTETSDAPRAPLEEWIDMCQGLTENEHFDTSSQLSKVMSIIAHLEDFPESDKHPPVDYRSIYRYLAQILQADRQEDVDQLKPLECAVLLDVIHSLMDVLGGTDTTVQHNVMQWKCTLLDQRDAFGHSMPENMRKVAENDFADFIEKDEEMWSERMELLRQRESDIDGTGKVIKRSTYEAQMSSESSNTVTERSQKPNMVSITTAAGKLVTYEQNWRHKPGRKRKKAPEEETPVTDIVVVLPPKNAKIINYQPRSKQARKDREDGKYQSLGKDKTGDIDNEIRIEAAIQESTTQAEYVKEVDTQDSNSNTSTQSKSGKEILREKLMQRQEAINIISAGFEEHKKKYKQLKENAAKPSKKKPKLYTINPFNIPVSLLDLDS